MLVILVFLDFLAEVLLKRAKMTKRTKVTNITNKTIIYRGGEKLMVSPHRLARGNHPTGWPAFCNISRSYRHALRSTCAPGRNLRQSI